MRFTSILQNKNSKCPKFACSIFCLCSSAEPVDRARRSVDCEKYQAEENLFYIENSKIKMVAKYLSKFPTNSRCKPERNQRINGKS